MLTKSKNIKERGTGWKEAPLFGSYEAEEKAITKWCHMTQETQEAAAKKQVLPIKRAFHAKGSGAKARFCILPNIPHDLQIGFFRPDARYDAHVRFSSVQSLFQADSKKDQRAMAIKVYTGESHKLLTGEEGDAQDFVMCDTPVSFARDAIDFMATVTLLLNSWTLLPKLFMRLHFRALVVLYRLFVDFFIRTPDNRSSYAAQNYWSRLPFKFGDLAVCFIVRPAGDVKKRVSSSGRNYMKEDLGQRLKNGDITFDLYIARFINEKNTPIENGTKEWKQWDEKPIARIIIPKQNIDEDSLQEEIERMEFSPWNTTEDFRPLGSLNRAKKRVYHASQTMRRSN